MPKPYREHDICYLKNWRLVRGYTQAQLSAISGVREATLSEVEGFRHAPSIETLDKLADVLCVDVDRMYTDPFEIIERRYPRRAYRRKA